MTVYASYTIVDHADLLTKAKAFFVSNGWTVSSATDTTFIITKSGVSHRIVTANNGKFSDWTYSSINYDATYECTIGIGDTVTTNVFCIVGAMPLPCVVDFFIFDDGGVLICAEVASGIWAQAYSGFLDTSLSGDGYFDKIISGSYGGGVRTGYNSANNYRINPAILAALRGYDGFLKAYNTAVASTSLFVGTTVSSSIDDLYQSATTFIRQADGIWVSSTCSATTYPSYATGIDTTFTFDGSTYYHQKTHPLYSNAAIYNFAPYFKDILPSPIYIPALCTTAQPLIMGQVKNMYYVSANSNVVLQEEITIGVYKFRVYTMGNGAYASSSYHYQYLAVRVA
ncbi:MAG: hypothetical protein R3Y11_00445 [Pseudomonadota bacterium]